MSKFNSTLKSKPDAVNLAGGEAYTKSPKLQIASLLLTNFCKDSYYETESQFINRLTELYANLPIEDRIFLAKAAIYARNEFGMRSITHVAANIVLDDLKWNKYPWASKFFSAVVSRPDDMSEILAYYWRNGKRSLPNSLMKGFANAFNKFDDYQVSKYIMGNKSVSLVDIVNLCHPKPSDRNKDSLQKLVSGTLKPAETFNNALAQAGRQAEDKAELAQSKRAVWKDFVAKGDKVEMFALLRNLRNICEDADEKTLDAALELLVNEKRIKKSKIMPFRFLTAFDLFRKRNSMKAVKVQEAIAEAMDICLANVPVFTGNTLVALDMSGSMFTNWNQNFDSDQPFTIGSAFAAALAKTSGARLCLFSNSAEYVTGYSKRDAVISIVTRIHQQASGGGTNFASVFDLIRRDSVAFDRIILITDEQAWIGNTRQALSDYKRAVGVDPKLYMFDLRGHSTLQFPERNCYSVAGMSDKTFDLMSRLETDQQAMVHAIEAIEL